MGTCANCQSGVRARPTPHALEGIDYRGVRTFADDATLVSPWAERKAGRSSAAAAAPASLDCAARTALSTAATATTTATKTITRRRRIATSATAPLTLAGGEIVPGEAEVARTVIARAGLERVVEVWEKTAALIAQADSVNLDRKQVVIGAFHQLQTAMRG